MVSCRLETRESTATVNYATSPLLFIIIIKIVIITLSVLAAGTSSFGPLLSTRSDDDHAAGTSSFGPLLSTRSDDDRAAGSSSFGPSLSTRSDDDLVDVLLDSVLMFVTDDRLCRQSFQLVM